MAFFIENIIKKHQMYKKYVCLIRIWKKSKRKNDELYYSK